MDNLNQVKDYFQNLVSNTNQINDFIYGDFDQLHHYWDGGTVGQTVLFMEWPEGIAEDVNGSYTIKYESTLYLLRVVPPDDYTIRNNTMSDIMEMITTKIFPRIRQDMFDTDDFFRISDSRNIEPVSFMTMNSLFGYMFTIEPGTWLPVNDDNADFWTDR